MGNRRAAKFIAAVLFLLIQHLSHLSGQTTAPATSGGSPRTAPLPYTAEYSSTMLQNLPDGGSIAIESAETVAVDSKGRQMHSSTPKREGATTEVYVSDPTNQTLSYWSVPGTTAQVMHAPDLGMDTDCSRKMKAINVLHPAGLPNLPIEDLGTKTILGIPVRGGRVVFAKGLLTQTNELWTATDPELDRLAVLTISATGQSQTWTEKLTKFSQAEPDPKLFEMPAGRQITRKNGMAYYCDLHLPAATPASH